MEGSEIDLDAEVLDLTIEDQNEAAKKKGPKPEDGPDWSTDKSVEQIEMELRLEKMLEKTQELIDERRRAYMLQNETFVLPPKVSVPDLADLRKQRRDTVDEITKIPVAPNPLIQLEAIHAETTLEAELENTPFHVHSLLIQYFEKQTACLQEKRMKHMLRFARYCQSSEVASRVQSSLDTRLRYMGEELYECRERLERLKSHPPVLMSEQDNLPTMIYVSDMRFFLRDQLHDAAVSRQIKSYMCRIQWMLYNHRFDIARRTKDLLHSIENQTLESQKAIRTQLPLMIMTKDKLHEDVIDLAKFFDIFDVKDLNDEYELLYRVNQLFSLRHSRQVRAKSFEVYGSEKNTPTLAPDGELDEEAIMQQVAAEKNPSDHKTGNIFRNLYDTPPPGYGKESNQLYLKTSRWVPYVSDRPNVEVRQAAQESKLCLIKKVDHVLRAEAGFLENDEEQFVLKRLKEQADTHSTRVYFSYRSFASDMEANISTNAFMHSKAGKGNVFDIHETKYQQKLPQHKLQTMYYLRYLRTRESKQKLLNVLNYFRSVQRKLTIDKNKFTMENEPEVAAVEENVDALEQTDGQTDTQKHKNPFSATSPILASLHNLHTVPPDFNIKPEDVEQLKELENNDDFWEIDEHGELLVKDSTGKYIVYDAAVQDLQDLEWSLLQLGTHYCSRYQEDCISESKDQAAPAVDRTALLADLYERESFYQEAKRKVINCYLEIYDNTFDPDVQAECRQKIIDLMAKRPRIDLTSTYFTDSYVSEIVCLELEFNLLRDSISHQIEREKSVRDRLYKKIGPFQINHTNGFPDPVFKIHAIPPISLFPESKEVGLLDFFPSMGKLMAIPRLIDYLLEEFSRLHELDSNLEVSCLHRTILQQAIVSWKLMQEDSKLLSMMNRPRAVVCLEDDLLMQDPLMVENIVREAAGQGQEATSKDVDQDGNYDSWEKGFTKNEIISALGIFFDAIEMVNLRERCVINFHETLVLYDVYRTQLHLLGQDSSGMHLDPLDFEGITKNRFGEAAEETVEDNPTANKEQMVNLAICELSKSFADVDMSTFNGVRDLLLGGKIDRLKRMQHIQTLEKNVFIISVEYNQVSLDPFMIKYGLKESDADQALALMKAASSNSASDTFITTSQEVAEDVDDLEFMKMSKRHGNAPSRTERFADMNKTAKYFVPIRTHKITYRNKLLQQFAEKAVKAMKGMRSGSLSKEKIDEKLEQVKGELIDDYAETLLASFSTYSLKSQIARMCEDLRNIVEDLPAEGAIFALGNDPDDDSIVLGAPEPGNETQERKKQLIGNSGKFENIFFVPHNKEILKLLQTIDNGRERHRILLSVLRVFVYLYDIVTYARFTAMVSLSSQQSRTEEDEDAITGLGLVNIELNKLMNEVDSLVDPTRGSQLVKYLSDKRNMLLRKHVLALDELRETFVKKSQHNSARIIKHSLLQIQQREDEVSLFRQWYSHPNITPEMIKRGEYLEKARKGLFIGCHQQQILSTLEKMLLAMNDAEKNYISAEVMQVELRLEDVLAENNIYQTSQPQEAVSYQLRFLATSLRLRALKKEFMRRKIGIEEPQSPEDIAAVQEAYETQVLGPVLRTLSGQDDGKYTELQARVNQLQLLRQMMDVELVRETYDSQCEGYDLLVSLRQKAVQQMGFVDKNMSKVKFAEEFLENIQRRGMHVKTENGNMAYVLPEKHLYETIDTFCMKLAEWGIEQQHLTRSNLEATIHHLTHLLYVREQTISNLTHKRENDSNDLKRRIITGVTDKGYSLIFEVDSLNRQLKDTKSEMDVLEITLREKIKKEFEALVEDLTVQLVTVKSNFKEYKDSLFKEMLTSLYEVKKEQMMKVVDSSSAPFELKRKTMKMSRVEDDMNELRDENHELKEAILKLRTMSKVKEIGSRGASDKKIRMLEETAKQKKSVWEIREEVEKRESLLRSQLVATQNALNASETERENLKKELELTNKNKQTLVQWKVAKSHLLEELEAKVKKYERWSQVDVDKLIIELEKKDADLRQYEDIESRVSRKNDLIEYKMGKEVERLKKQLNREQKLKQDAFKKLETVRGNVGAEAQDPRAAIRWEERYKNAADKMQTIQRENEMLRKALREAGILPPSLRGTDKMGKSPSSKMFRPVSAPVDDLGVAHASFAGSGDQYSQSGSSPPPPRPATTQAKYGASQGVVGMVGMSPDSGSDLPPVRSSAGSPPGGSRPGSVQANRRPASRAWNAGRY